MTGSRGMLIKFSIFAVIMAMLTAFLFIAFGQVRSGSTNGYSAVFADASRLKGGDSVRVAGVRVGTVNDVQLQSDRSVLVKFDADKDIGCIILTGSEKAFAAGADITRTQNPWVQDLGSGSSASKTAGSATSPSSTVGTPARRAAPKAAATPAGQRTSPSTAWVPAISAAVLVMILMTPAYASAPYKAEPGPRITSMDLTAFKSILPGCPIPSGMLNGIPST